VLQLAGPKVEDFLKHRPSGGLTLGEIQKIAFDTAKSLSYLHANRYVHGGKKSYSFAFQFPREDIVI
jgi:serine/threonine protein kinase